MKSDIAGPTRQALIENEENCDVILTRALLTGWNGTDVCELFPEVIDIVDAAGELTCATSQTEFERLRTAAGERHGSSCGGDCDRSSTVRRQYHR